jgi:hypothetical protein
VEAVLCGGACLHLSSAEGGVNGGGGVAAL